MIEIIPYLVIILAWHPDRPGDVHVDRPEILFESEEKCDEIGAQMAARMTEVAKSQSGATYEHRCFSIPSNEEFDHMFESMEAGGR